MAFTVFLLMTCTLFACIPIVQSVCNNLIDCSLGGKCINNTCICDPTWRGEYCDVLNLMPADNYQAYYHDSESSWGGSVLYNTTSKEYHMFVSDMSYNCSLAQWQSNSRIVHAISNTPDGPYRKLNVAVNIWGHNPTAHITPDKKHYVIYHIGNGQYHDGPPVNCTANMTEKRNNHPINTIINTIDSDPNHPNYAIASNLNDNTKNNFVEVNSNGGDYAYNNPSVYFFPNGSALLIYKIGCPNITQTFCRQFALATAPSYNGPFTFMRNINVYGEDAYVFRDLNGYFHMLFQGGNYGHGTPSYIGHFHTAFSMDGIHWTVANHTQAYNSTITLTNGKSVQVGRRERCQLLFDEETGLPSYLFNGVGDTNFSYTSVQPINIV